MEHLDTTTHAAFSLRSQRSWRRELDLQEEIKRLNFLKAEAGSALASFVTKQRELEAEILAGGTGAAQANVTLGSVISKRAGEERKVQLFEDKIAALDSEIAAEREIPAERKAKRAEILLQIASLASERMEVDTRIDAVLQDLKSLLGRAMSLTSRMGQPGDEIDLWAALDGETYEELAKALPASWLTERREWFEGFLGTNKGLKPFVVRNKFLIVHESLAHSGVYLQGDVIHLADSISSQMLRRDRLSGSETDPYLRPDIITVEQHEKALESCQQRGIDFGDWVREDDQRHDLWAREQYLAKTGKSTTRRVEAWQAQN